MQLLTSKIIHKSFKSILIKWLWLRRNDVLMKFLSLKRSLKYGMLIETNDNNDASLVSMPYEEEFRIPFSLWVVGLTKHRVVMYYYAVSCLPRFVKIFFSQLMWSGFQINDSAVRNTWSFLYPTKYKANICLSKTIKFSNLFFRLNLIYITNDNLSQNELFYYCLSRSENRWSFA